MRPSLVFGPEDRFFNTFAALARISPVLPLIGGGKTRVQPVFAGDVARAIAAILSTPETTGRAYDLGGPQSTTLADLMAMVLKLTGRRRLLLPVPWFAARAMASVLQFMPGKPLTMDQVELLKSDLSVPEKAIAEKRTFAGLGITPEAMAAIVPAMLQRYRAAGQYSSAADNPLVHED